MLHVHEIFLYDGVSDEPWVLWEQKQAVFSIRDTEKLPFQYETPMVNVPDTSCSSKPANDKQPQISRMQYHSVLNRMKRANGNTGQYTLWNT